MVDQYNLKARAEGLEGKVHAVQGNLVDDTESTADLSAPEYTGFDVVAISMALHHVDDPGALIRKLADRVRAGGRLLIIDNVAPSESGLKTSSKPDEMAKMGATRSGFEKQELQSWFEENGLDMEQQWFSERMKVPEEHGGEIQIFIAKGTKGTKTSD